MKVSIITAAYNSAKTIADTIRSVAAQDYNDIEHIIVDGGSTDGTMDIVRSFEPQLGGRLRWISEKDRGLYDAMNKGIAMATGEIVGILNSDDYYTSNDVVSRFMPYFNDETIDSIFGDIHFIHDGAPNKTVRYYSSKRFRPLWLRFGFMPAHPSFYVRKSVYDRAGGYKLDYKIGSDFEMVVRLYKKMRITYKYIPMDFVTMRTGGLSNRNLKSRITLVKEDIRACRENGVYTNAFMICTKFTYKLFGLRLSYWCNFQWNRTAKECNASINR